MATSTDVTTTFAGERDQAIKYVSAALFGGETLASGALTIKDKIHKKRVMKTLSISGTLIKAKTTLFTPTGTVTVGERTLEPKDLEVNIELVKSDFEDDWDAPQMGDSAHKVLAKDLQQAFVLELVNIVAEDLEVKIWQGDNGVNEMLGLLVRAKADTAIPAAQKITNTAINSGNVITELGKIVTAIPAGVRSKNDSAVYISNTIKYAYIDALGGFGANGLGGNGVQGNGPMWYNEGNALSFRGMELIALPGITDDHAMAFRKSTSWFGTDLMGDYTEVKILDQSMGTGDDVVRCIMKFSADTNYTLSSEVVYYGTTG